MNNLKVGDTAWVANVGNQQILILCEICFGKKVVTLVLGNGEHVELPCGYCGNGYEAPTGKNSIYKFVSEPKQIVIDEVKTNETINGTVKTYCSGHRHYEENQIFLTGEQAEIECEKIKTKMENDQQTRAEHIKKDVKKSFAWNAGYHLKRAKDDEKSAEYHRSMVKLCNERKREN
jgi:hypothetical protein